MSNLLKFNSYVFGGIARTTVAPALFDENYLTLEQENRNTREDKYDDDMIVLDVESQRKLYELLKTKFEG